MAILAQLKGMEVLMNKYFLYLFLTVISGVTLAVAINTLKKPVFTPFKGSKMAQELFIERKAAHDQILAKIKEEFQISDLNWSQFIGNCHAFIEHDDLMGIGASTIKEDDHDLIKFAKNALVEYGVNPERVIVQNVGMSGSPCNGTQLLENMDSLTYGPDNKIVHYLNLNLSWLKEYDRDVQEAFVLHEIMHLINYDSIEGAYVTTMLEFLGHKPEEYALKQSRIDYCHQREMRADLLASCDRAPVAQALQKFFQASIKKDPRQDVPSLWISHPSDKARNQQLADLLIKMDHQPKLA